MTESSRYLLVHFLKYVSRRLPPRWNQQRLSLAHLGCDVISRHGCTGVEFYANDPVNHFIHAPSSRSRKSTPFPVAFRIRPFENGPTPWPKRYIREMSRPIPRRSRLYHFRIRNASRLKIQSRWETRLPNLDDTCESIRLRSSWQKWIITFVFLLLHFSSPQHFFIVTKVLIFGKNWSITDAFNVSALYDIE